MAERCSSEEGWGVLQGFTNFTVGHSRKPSFQSYYRASGRHSHSPPSLPTGRVLLPHMYPNTVPLGIMKLFSCSQVFRSTWLTRPPGRLFHKVHGLCAPLTLADFEAINLCERPVPKNFNFAGDVLDQWSQKEKVDDDKPRLDARCPSVFLFCDLLRIFNSFFHFSCLP